MLDDDDLDQDAIKGEDGLKGDNDDDEMDDMDDDLDDDDLEDDLNDEKHTLETLSTFRTESGHEVVMSVVVPRSLTVTTTASHTSAAGGAGQPVTANVVPGTSVTIEAVKLEARSMPVSTATITTTTPPSSSSSSSGTALTNAAALVVAGGAGGTKVSPPAANQIIWMAANHPPPPPLYAIKQQMNYGQVKRG